MLHPPYRPTSFQRLSATFHQLQAALENIHLESVAGMHLSLRPQIYPATVLMALRTGDMTYPSKPKMLLHRHIREETHRHGLISSSHTYPRIYV